MRGIPWPLERLSVSQEILLSTVLGDLAERLTERFAFWSVSKVLDRRKSCPVSFRIIQNSCLHHPCPQIFFSHEGSKRKRDNLFCHSVTKFLEVFRAINFSAVALLQLVLWRFQHVLPMRVTLSFFQTTADLLAPCNNALKAQCDSFYETFIEICLLNDILLEGYYFSISLSDY
jgi:hypothetical protein